MEAEIEEQLVLCNNDLAWFVAQANRAQLPVRSRDSLARHTPGISASEWLNTRTLWHGIGENCRKQRSFSGAFTLSDSTQTMLAIPVSWFY
jgi:hypothetical protein